MLFNRKEMFLKGQVGWQIVMALSDCYFSVSVSCLAGGTFNPLCFVSLGQLEDTTLYMTCQTDVPERGFIACFRAL